MGRWFNAIHIRPHYVVGDQRTGNICSERWARKGCKVSPRPNPFTDLGFRLLQIFWHYGTALPTFGRKSHISEACKSPILCVVSQVPVRPTPWVTLHRTPSGWCPEQPPSCSPLRLVTPHTCTALPCPTSRCGGAGRHGPRIDQAHNAPQHML